MVANPIVGKTYYYVVGRRLISIRVDSVRRDYYGHGMVVNGFSAKGALLAAKTFDQIYETPAEAYAVGIKRLKEKLDKNVKVEDQLGTMTMKWSEAAGVPLVDPSPPPTIEERREQLKDILEGWTLEDPAEQHATWTAIKVFIDRLEAA